MDCYILHTYLYVTKLISIIAIICYHYIKYSQNKNILITTNIKTENNETKKVGIKNRMSYYFDDIIKIQDFDFGNILLEEKSYENVFIYDVSCKTFIGAKPLCIMFDKANGLIRYYDGTKYLVTFGPETYDAIFDWIRYLTGLISGIKYVVSHYNAKI